MYYLYCVGDVFHVIWKGENVTYFMKDKQDASPLEVTHETIYEYEHLFHDVSENMYFNSDTHGLYIDTEFEIPLKPLHPDLFI